MFKKLFCLLPLVFASPASAQAVVGSFKNDNVEVSLLFDGRWGIVTQAEVKCGNLAQPALCIEHAIGFMEDSSLAPVDIDLRGVTFADTGVFVGRTFGSSATDTVEVAQGFMEDLAAVYNVPDGGIRLLSTEAGSIGNQVYIRYEFLSELENGPVWSTVTRFRDGSQTADIGTHVFGEFWTIDPDMFIIRRDFHQRVIENAAFDWIEAIPQ